MAVLNPSAAVYLIIICSPFLISSALIINQTEVKDSNSSEISDSNHVLLTDTDPNCFSTDTNGNESQTENPMENMSQNRSIHSELDKNIEKEKSSEMKALIRFEDSMKEFINISNRFSIKLYSFMSSVYPNFIFSPISVTVMLSLLLRASSGNSYNEIYRTLDLDKSNLNMTSVQNSVEHLLNYFKLPLDSGSATELELWNGICLRDGTKIITNFLHDSNRYFGAKVKGINFKLGSKRTDPKIIKWMEENMKSRLVRAKIMLEPFRDDTNIVIFNGINFSAIPELQNFVFIERDFYAFGSHVIRTQFIQSAETVNTTNSEHFKSSILEIPLHSSTGAKRFALIIVLPNNNHSLGSVEHLIQSNSDQFFSELTQLKSRFVNLIIPQQFMRPECWRLDRILPHIGLKSVFQPETSLISKISAYESMHISRIYHESYFELNRLNHDIFHDSKTSEAIGSQKQSQIELDFLANRPFIYMITERHSSALVLMGRINII